MKITAVQYAKSLYEATANKSQKEIAASVANLVKLLIQKRQLKLASTVVSKFNEIWNEKHGIVEVEVTSREKLSHELRNKVSSYVSSKYGAKEVVIKNIIDEKIQGGVVIRVGDDILDGSVQTQLSNLRNILIK